MTGKVTQRLDSVVLIVTDPENCSGRSAAQGKPVHLLED